MKKITLVDLMEIYCISDTWCLKLRTPAQWKFVCLLPNGNWQKYKNREVIALYTYDKTILIATED